ncbi:predicted protein [Uncinocarpus reesii 1704]|uniref:Uncharacterized protein n=1 Tax=Uncinocarpus reesii (strain UAMH 1704) TaxID=336963 RepID=C4JHK1_UNCRE|nr:uncharacterized protein UREG_01364 [Uncinocarpus reesii 1704]EEP76515.1 predicted protein [Uncinocarpus reesii 1704]
MILWNATGAAIIQPPYFYCIAKSKATSRDPTIPLNEAISLFMTTIPALLCPLLLFVPVWLNYSTWSHHGFIAIFHVSPILVILIFIAGVIILLPRHGLVSKKDAKNPDADKPWIVASYVTAGIVSSVVHIATVLTSLRTVSSDATFARVFIPSPGRANLFPSWFPNPASTLSGLPTKYVELLEQYHLFTQFDLIVIALSCIVFVHALLPNTRGDDAKFGPKTKAAIEKRELAYLFLGTLVIGPGGAGSFALAIRESRIREHAEVKGQ